MASSNTNEPVQDQNQEKHDPLPLPAPPTGDDVHKLDMSSGSAEIKMDHLGPLVVGKDGTLGRIENWGEMTEIERRNTLRVLGKRNRQRQEALKAQETAGNGGKADAKEEL